MDKSEKELGILVPKLLWSALWELRGYFFRFPFIFWKNWEYQKVLWKLTHLYPSHWRAWSINAQLLLCVCSGAGGQLISKANCQAWILPKNEQMNLFLLVWDVFSFVFWRKLKTPKKHFEIIWPLILDQGIEGLTNLKCPMLSLYKQVLLWSFLLMCRQVCHQEFSRARPRGIDTLLLVLSMVASPSWTQTNDPLFHFKYGWFLNRLSICFLAFK